MIGVSHNKHNKRRRRIEELQRRRSQLNAFLVEDAEDAIVHGWAMPDHREYFAELKAIENELRQLGAE